MTTFQAHRWDKFSVISKTVLLCRWGLEYFDSTYTAKRLSCITLNSIRRRGCSSESLKRVKYCSLWLLPGALWFEVVVPVRVQSMGRIDLFENNKCYFGSVWFGLVLWHIHNRLFHAKSYLYTYIKYIRGAYDTFADFFVWALLLIVRTRNSSPLWSILLRLQCTCCTVPTTSARPHGSPLVWACQWPSSYLPTPPLGQDMTQSQFLSRV